MSSSGKWNNSAAVVKNLAVCIQPMGVIALISGVAGAAAPLVEGFLTLTGVSWGAESGLVLVAIRVKL
jgi:hypothetical protein